MRTKAGCAAAVEWSVASMPVCKKTESSRTEFCKHCWGASLNSAEPMPYKEAMAFAQLLLQNKKKHRMTWIALFIIIPLLITVGSHCCISTVIRFIMGPYTRALNSNSTPGDWAMFRGNLSRTGSTDSSTTQPQGVLAWSFQTGGKYIRHRR